MNQILELQQNPHFSPLRVNCRLPNVRILEKIYRHRTVTLFCSFLLLYYRFFVGFVTHLLDFFGLLHWGWLSYDGTSVLQWRHNERDRVSTHRRLDCLLNRLFRRRSKKTVCVIGIYEGNPPMTGWFPSQRASDAENVSIWWCHPGSYPAKKRVKLTCVKSRVSVTASHCIWNKQQGPFYQEMETDIRVSESNQHCFKTLSKPLMGWDP